LANWVQYPTIVADMACSSALSIKGDGIATRIAGARLAQRFNGDRACGTHSPSKSRNIADRLPQGLRGRFEDPAGDDTL
jgi:hypothetical protein